MLLFYISLAMLANNEKNNVYFCTHTYKRASNDETRALLIFKERLENLLLEYYLSELCNKNQSNNGYIILRPNLYEITKFLVTDEDTQNLVMKYYDDSEKQIENKTNEVPVGHNKLLDAQKTMKEQEELLDEQNNTLKFEFRRLYHFFWQKFLEVNDKNSELDMISQITAKYYQLVIQKHSDKNFDGSIYTSNCVMITNTDEKLSKIIKNLVNNKESNCQTNFLMINDSSYYETKSYKYKIVKNNLFSGLTPDECKTVLSTWTFAYVNIVYTENEENQKSIDIMTYDLYETNDYITNYMLNSNFYDYLHYFRNIWISKNNKHATKYVIYDICSKNNIQEIITETIIMPIFDKVIYNTNINLSNKSYVTSVLEEMLIKLNNKMKIEKMDDIFNNILQVKESINNNIINKESDKIEYAKKIAIKFFTKTFLEMDQNSTIMNNKTRDNTQNYNNKLMNIQKYLLTTNLYTLDIKHINDNDLNIVKYLNKKLSNEEKNTNIIIDFYINISDYLQTITNETFENEQIQKKIDLDFQQNHNLLDDYRRILHENKIKITVNIKIYTCHSIIIDKENIENHNIVGNERKENNQLHNAVFSDSAEYCKKKFEEISIKLN